MRPVRKIVLPVLAFIIFVGCNQLFDTLPQISQDIPPTPPNYRTVADIFPDDPHCSDIEGVSPGPEWNTIVVGKSSVEELLSTLQQMGNYRKSEVYEDAERWAFLLQPGDFTQPPWIDACVRDNRVTALNFHVQQPYDVYMLFALYSEPDTLADTAEYNTKLFFWFEEGIMAEVWSEEGDSYGIVGIIILMPYQSPEGYQQRYPFTIIPE
jgi:hypothetical protein